MSVLPAADGGSVGSSSDAQVEHDKRKMTFKAPFNGNRWPQDTQYGLYRHFMDMTDPRCLAPGFFFDMPLATASKLLQEYTGAADSKTHQDINYDSDKLWLAKKIHTSAIHPDTGEEILQPFRMSGFVVYGSIIVSGMLLPNPTANILQTVFWQSINQTHNAAFNYANRNATAGTTTGSLLKGYLGALVSSVSIAVGLGQALKRVELPAATRALASRFVPYPAVATANVANVLMMRWAELDQGIDVKDAEGESRGISKSAAKAALFDTCITRVVLPMPLLLLPPTIMSQVGKIKALKKSPRLSLMAEAAVCVSCFLVGLPFALSLFPQEQTISVNELEPEFQNLADAKTGAPLHHLSYNKGL